MRLAPYRGAQLEMPKRLAHSYAEHDAIVAAILRGEADRAATLLHEHLTITQETLVSLLSVRR